MPSLKTVGVPMTAEMERYLLDGTPTTSDRPLVPRTPTTGRWVGLLTGGDGGDALVEAAWHGHKARLMRAAHPGKPLAWYWFDAPEPERLPLGMAPSRPLDDEDEEANDL